MTFSSCRKEGCKDVNGVNFNASADIHDGLCTYRYLNDITLVRMPFTRPSGAFWDSPNADPLVYPGEEYPDLKFYVKRNNSTHWEYQTTVEFDAINTPVRWNIRDFGSNHLLMGTEYEYKLVDEDEKSEEILMEGTFIPSQVLQENKIFLQNPTQTIAVELNYIIS
jgi:hypothetical protein